MGCSPGNFFNAKHACCWLPLTLGTLLASVYTIVLSSVAIGYYSYRLDGGLRKSVDAVTTGHHNDTHYMEQAEQYRNAMVTIYVVGLTIYVPWFCSGVLVVIAVLLARRLLMVPWIVFTTILTLFSIYGIGDNISRMVVGQGSQEVFWLQFIVVITSFVGNLIALSAVVSLYRNDMKEPEGCGPGVMDNDAVEAVSRPRGQPKDEPGSTVPYEYFA